MQAPGFIWATAVILDIPDMGFSKSLQITLWTHLSVSKTQLDILFIIFHFCFASVVLGYDALGFKISQIPINFSFIGMIVVTIYYQNRFWLIVFYCVHRETREGSGYLCQSFWWEGLCVFCGLGWDQPEDPGSKTHLIDKSLTNWETQHRES